MSNADSEPRKSGVPVWVWIILTAFVGGGLLCMVVCGGVLWFAFARYALLLEADPAIEPLPPQEIKEAIRPAPVVEPESMPKRIITIDPTDYDSKANPDSDGRLRPKAEETEPEASDSAR